MNTPFNHDDMQKLKSFIEFVTANPAILNSPHLDFVKNFIEKFGGKVPAGEFKMPGSGKCPFGGDTAGGADTKSDPSAAGAGNESDDSEPAIEIETESEPESEIELDMDGVIEADPEDVNQKMGDSAKEPTEDDIDKASDLRGKAAAAYSEQKFDEAIQLYSEAIELNPGMALFHAKRGQAYLKLKKPNACIRDCNAALELNHDSAAAYKFRGRAHRLLGAWEQAAKDLRQACKLDFDEETDEWLREVTPNATKIEQHRIKQERNQAERKRKEQKKAERKARKADSANSNQFKFNATPGGMPRTGGPGGFPPGFNPFASFGGTGGGGGGGGPGGFPLGDLLTDPEIAAAVRDIAANPLNINKYKSNPKIVELIKVMFPKGFSEAFNPEAFTEAAAAAAAADIDVDANTNADAASDDLPKPKESAAATAAADTAAASVGEKKTKPDFVDDGLD